jgi:hypothetical protein
VNLASKVALGKSLYQNHKIYQNLERKALGLSCRDIRTWWPNNIFMASLAWVPWCPAGKLAGYKFQLLEHWFFHESLKFSGGIHSQLGLKLQTQSSLGCQD